MLLFKANEAVNANEELNTDIEAVWLLSITLNPLTPKLPVTVTEPVNCCVLVNWLPNMFDPEEYITDEVIVWITNVWAVTVPVIKALDAVISFLTRKLSAEDAVAA